MQRFIAPSARPNATAVRRPGLAADLRPPPRDEDHGGEREPAERRACRPELVEQLDGERRADLQRRDGEDDEGDAAAHAPSMPSRMRCQPELERVGRVVEAAGLVERAQRREALRLVVLLPERRAVRPEAPRPRRPPRTAGRRRGVAATSSTAATASAGEAPVPAARRAARRTRRPAFGPSGGRATEGSSSHGWRRRSSRTARAWAAPLARASRRRCPAPARPGRRRPSHRSARPCRARSDRSPSSPRRAQPATRRMETAPSPSGVRERDAGGGDPPHAQRGRRPTAAAARVWTRGGRSSRSSIPG